MSHILGEKRSNSYKGILVHVSRAKDGHLSTSNFSALKSLSGHYDGKSNVKTLDVATRPN